MTEFKKEISDLRQADPGQRVKLLIQDSAGIYSKQCPHLHHSSVSVVHYTEPRPTGFGHIAVGTSTSYVPWRYNDTERRTLVNNANGVFDSTSLTVDSISRFGVGESIKILHADTGAISAVAKITAASGSILTLDRGVTCPDNSVVSPVYPTVYRRGENFVVKTQPVICIKVTVAGYYTVQAELDMDFESNLATVVHYCLFRNGVDQDSLGLATIRELSSGTQLNRFYITGLVYLEKGDEVDFRVKKESGTDSDILYANHRISMQMYCPV